MGPRGQYSFYRETWGTRRGGWGRHFAKYSSHPRQAYPIVKPQGRDLVRVVGIIAPFAPMGAGTRGKFVLSSRRGEMGPGDVCRVPLAAVCHRRERQTSESGPYGDCRRVLRVPGQRGQYSGKIRFIDKHWIQDEGFAMLLNIILTPVKPTLSQTSGTGLVRVVGIVATFAPIGAGIRGKFVLSSPRGKWG